MSQAAEMAQDGLHVIQESAKKLKPSTGRVFVEVPLPLAMDFRKRPTSKEPAPKQREKAVHERLGNKFLKLKKKDKRISIQARHSKLKSQKMKATTKSE